MDITAPYKIIQSKLSEWIEQTIRLLPNLVVAALIVLASYVLARIVRTAVGKLLGRTSVPPSVSRLASSVLFLILFLTGIFVALGVLQLDKAVTSLLAGAGIIGLAISFAFQDLVTNFVSGILITIRRPYRVGDIVETNDVFGRVKGINLRTTDLETFQGQTVLIPNKQAFQNPIVNYSEKGYRRVDLAVGISYGDDLEKVSKVTLEAVREIETLDESRDVDLYFEEFGNSSINFVVRFWVRFAKQTDYLEAKSESIKRIKAAYDRNDITIPFPIRTLDFGIKGGEKLSEILPSHGASTS